MPRTATAPVARPNFVPMPRTAPSAVTPVVAHLRTPPPDALIEPHHHEWGQLICPQRGGLRITAGETSLIVPVFRAAWVPAGMSHEVAVLGEAQFYAVYMMSEVSPLPAERCLVLDVSPLLRDLAAAMAGGMASDDPRHGLVTSLLLEELRVAPTASLDLRMPDDRRLRPLCQGLMERPEDDRSLAQWAEDVGASERTLARLFSTELGTSFGVWRQRVRIARAVDWMSRGVPVATVASRLGYANPAAFSAMFRRALGVSPRDFTRVERAKL